MRRRTVILGLAAAMAGVATSSAANTYLSPAPTPPPTAPVLPAQAPTPVTPTPGTAPARAFAVGTRTLAFDRGEDRPLPVSLWYPATGDVAAAPVENAPVAAGRFPVVLFSHGLTARPTDYQAMLIRWTQAGFVVAAPAYPHTAGGVPDHNPTDVPNQPADAAEVLGQLLAKDKAADDPLAGHLQVDRVAAAGHSAGAITTIGLFTAARDVRLRAGIVLNGTVLDASAPFTGAPAPLLFVHGAKDDTVPYAYGKQVFEATPWSRALLTVTDGGHLTTGADFEATAGTSVEFLRWALYGDAAAKAAIPAKAATGGVATLIDQL